MSYLKMDGPMYETPLAVETTSCRSSRKRHGITMTVGFDVMWGAGYREFIGGSNARMS
jgi:hypothetical protein